MLAGYKTYILGGVTIVGYVAAYLVGSADLTTTINMSIGAIMAMFIRNGVTTAATNAVNSAVDATKK